jgi:hypothetical protein
LVDQVSERRGLLKLAPEEIKMVAGIENFIAQDPYLKIEYGGKIWNTKILHQKSGSSRQFDEEF